MTQNDKGKFESPANQDTFQSQFQNFQSEIKAPVEIGEAVFDTLDNLTLISDVFELFTTQFLEAESKMIELLDIRFDKEQHPGGNGDEETKNRESDFMNL